MLGRIVAAKVYAGDFDADNNQETSYRSGRCNSSQDQGSEALQEAQSIRIGIQQNNAEAQIGESQST
jgi:hypothetical protein